MTSTTDPFERWNLTPVINASGTMTSIGASKVHPEVIEVVSKILGSFVSMDELQSRASEVIAAACGAEAGCVTGCSAAAMTQAVAATMTGSDLASIEQLPVTAHGEHPVAIQAGHLINYGAPIGQAIALAGASVRPVGTAALCEVSHLRSALEGSCRAALYVVSHHTVREGELPLDLFIETCHHHDVPVIVDMAAEYDLKGPIALGADVVIYSGHKFLSGTTSGIVAGQRDLVRAIYLQHRGIGRTMKAGKESVAGAIAALEVWARRNEQRIREGDLAIVEQWRDRLGGVAGLSCALHDDWTGNPVTRLCIRVNPDESGLFAWELAERLAAQDPKIVVRDDLVEHGEIYLDPCNLNEEDAEKVSEEIIAVTTAAKTTGDGRKKSWSDVKRQRDALMNAWPGGSAGA